MKKKKPDLVVWEDSRGYYARELTYGSNLGAPSIQLENVVGWRTQGASELNARFAIEYQELLEKAEQLQSEFLWNEFVYTKVTYSFVPIIGHVYYIYKNSNDTFFMSLIEPGSWTMEFVAATKLDLAHKWIRINQ